MKIRKLLNKLRGKINIFLLLLLALILRLININQSLWHDEAIGALVNRSMNVKEIFTNFIIVDNHPPLYYLLQEFETQVFGYSELSLRLPSVIFGVLTVYFVYLIAKRYIKVHRVAVLAPLLMATSQLHIYYSQEARMYSMSTFFVTLLMYLYLELRQTDNLRKFKFILFSIVLAVISMTDYLPVLIILTIGLDLAISHRPKVWKLKFIYTLLPMIFFMILWSPFFIKQSEGGKWLLDALPKWKDLAGGTGVKQVLLLWTKFTGGRISFINKYLYGIYLFIVTLIFAFPFVKVNIKNIFKEYRVFSLWFLVPVLAAYLISFWIPAFNYFRLIFVLPAFYILLSICVFHYTKKNLTKFFVAVIILINVFSLVTYNLNVRTQREQWRQSVRFVENKLSKNDIVLFSYPEPFSGYRWYEQKPEKSFGATDSLVTNYEASKLLTLKLIEGKSSIYYFEYLSDLSDPGKVVMTTLFDSGFTEKAIYSQFSGIGNIYRFAK